MTHMNSTSLKFEVEVQKRHTKKYKDNPHQTYISDRLLVDAGMDAAPNDGYVARVYWKVP